jgi:hypothetical protein
MKRKQRAQPRNKATAGSQADVRDRGLREVVSLRLPHKTVAALDAAAAAEGISRGDLLVELVDAGVLDLQRVHRTALAACPEPERRDILRDAALNGLLRSLSPGLQMKRTD